MYQYFLTPLYTSLVLLMVNIHIRFQNFIHCENKDKLNPVQEFMTQEFHSDLPIYGQCKMQK